MVTSGVFTLQDGTEVDPNIAPDGQLCDFRFAYDDPSTILDLAASGLATVAAEDIPDTATDGVEAIMVEQDFVINFQNSATLAYDEQVYSGTAHVMIGTCDLTFELQKDITGSTVVAYREMEPLFTMPEKAFQSQGGACGCTYS